MWHTHRAKYCSRASQSDKREAKNAKLSEIGHFSKEELLTMGVGRLRKILQEMISVHRSKVSDAELKEHYHWRTFLEKSEYIGAILKFESIYGISGQYNANESPPMHCAADGDGDGQHSNPFPTTYDGLKRLKIRELSQFLRDRHIDPQSSEHNCIEKADLIRLVMRTQQYYRDIINGQSYDPRLEKQQFSPPPNLNHPQPDEPLHAPSAFHLDEDEVENEEEEEEEEEGQHGDEEKMEDLRQGNGLRNGQYNGNGDGGTSPPRASAYQYTAEHLRQSSANRIDLNRLRPNGAAPEAASSASTSSTAYSHVYRAHEHSNAVNRDNLNGLNGHPQSMYSDGDRMNHFDRFTQTSMPQHPHNSAHGHGTTHNHNQHQHQHHHHRQQHYDQNQHQNINFTQNQQQYFNPPHPEQHESHHQQQHGQFHQQQMPSWFPPMPAMPSMPTMPHIPPIAPMQMPAMPPMPHMPNVSEMYNNAMNGVNAIFGGPPPNNSHHCQTLLMFEGPLIFVFAP